MNEAATNTQTGADVLVSTDAGIAILTLNRPNRYNTLSMPVLQELSDQLTEIAGNEAIRVVIIAATGKAFSTGHDLKDLRANAGEGYYQDLFSLCSRTLQAIVNLPQPVIARVQGIATAAGCQLVASCDLAVAARSARFATSGINYGIFCTTPAVAVSRTVARKHALEMLLTGDFIDAERAAEIGLVNRVVDDEDLEQESLALARRIAEKPPFTLRLGKRSFNEQLGKPLAEAYGIASEDIICNLLSSEGREGLDAFSEKRPPRWLDKSPES